MLVLLPWVLMSDRWNTQVRQSNLLEWYLRFHSHGYFSRLCIHQTTSLTFRLLAYHLLPFARDVTYCEQHSKWAKVSVKSSPWRFVQHSLSMFESVYNGDHNRFLHVCDQTTLHYLPFGGWAVENDDQTSLASQTSLVTKLEKYSRIGTPTKKCGWDTRLWPNKVSKSCV